MDTVLVTGGSGFVGARLILQLLADGHRVRTTVRSLAREPMVRAMLREGGVEAGERLSFAAADLEQDEGWAAAVADCRYVHHVASPFPAGGPRHEDDLIKPARDGTLRVLRAARDAGVERLVLTSSFAAIGYGVGPRSAPFDETSWSDLQGPGVTAYVKSKALAERAAWDFIAAEGGGLELSVINPVGVFGPVLGEDISSSTQIVQRMLNGAIPACPRLYFGVVDVRDVADLHVRAMSHSAAKGERFLAVAGDCVSMLDVARMLRAGLGEAASRAPTRQIPSWLIRLMALRNPAMREMVPQLDRIRRSSNDKAKRLLQWSPRSNAEAVVATGESLLRLGLVKGEASRRDG